MVNRTNRALIRVASALLAPAVLTACGLLGDRVDCDEVPAMLPIIAPPGASDLTERCSSGINPTYRATFSMSPDVLETFQRSTRITEWRTDASTTRGEFGDGAVLIEVQIDTSDPDRYVVDYRSTFVD